MSQSNATDLALKDKDVNQFLDMFINIPKDPPTFDP